MLTVLCIFIAFAFGFMLFVQLQEDLPPELDFLKPAATSTAASGTLLTGIAYKGWLVTQSRDGKNIELKHALEGAPSPGGIAVLCAGGAPSVMLTRAGLVSDQVTVQIGSLAPSVWYAAAGGGFVPEPAQVQLVLRMLAGRNLLVPVKLRTHEVFETQALDSDGFTELYKQFPATCQ